MYACDYCLTAQELKRAKLTVHELPSNNKTDEIEMKVDNLSDEISTIKQLLTDLTNTSKASANPTAVSDPVATPSHNMWKDNERSAKMRTLLSLSADKDGRVVSQGTLDKLLIENGVQVKKTIITNSKETRLILPDKMASGRVMKMFAEKLPNHTVTEIKPRMPVVNVVGLPTDYTTNESELINIIKFQNPGLTDLIEKDSTAFQVLGIKPLKKATSIFKATIRVSDEVRAAIASQGDRVYFKTYSCKTYDSFYVRRCFKCQMFGHYAKDCRNDSVCGVCAGTHTHDTKNCSKPECCVNCKKGGFKPDQCAHSAFSSTCLSYKKEQNKLRSSIGYFQKNSL